MKSTYLFVVFLILTLCLHSCAMNDGNANTSDEQSAISEVSDVTSSTESDETSGETSSTESDETSGETSSTESEDISEISIPEQDLSSWVGEYEYGIQVYNETDDIMYGYGYSLTIYEEDSRYYGHITAEGRQLEHYFEIYFIGDDDRIDGYFLRDNSEDTVSTNFTHPLLEVGDEVFSLIRKDSEIYTITQGYNIVGFEKGEENIIFTKVEDSE